MMVLSIMDSGEKSKLTDGFGYDPKIFVAEPYLKTFFNVS
jgi:inosine/xanthosine triphosphate pyrophosphatase family protein